MKFTATYGPESWTFHAVDMAQAIRKAVQFFQVPKSKRDLLEVKQTG